MDGLLQGIGINTVMACGLAVMAWALGYLWRRPQVLHVLWVLVLLKLVTPPVWEVPVAWGESRSVTTIHQMPPLEATASEISEDVQSSEIVEVPDASGPLSHGVDSELRVGPPEIEAPAEPFPWIQSLLILWLLGSIVMTVGVLFGLRKVTALLCKGEEAPCQLLARVATLSEQLSLKRTPRIRLVSLKASPFVVRLLGGAWLVLPKPLVKTFGEDQLDSVLAHELLHLKRGDHWVRWLESVVGVLFWWHPLVWWARRELSALEEECCDAAILTHWPNWRKPYAAALTRTFDWVSDPAPMLASGLGSPFGQFVKRLERIAQGRVRPPVTRFLMWVLVMGGALWLGMAVSLTQQPESQEVSSDDPGYILSNYETEDELGDGDMRLFRDFHRQDIEVVRKVRLQLPARRGRILDRRGKVLAGDRVVDYLVLTMQVLVREAADDVVISTGQELVTQANELLGTAWSVTDDAILTNFRHRRAVPLLIEDPLTNEQRAKLIEADLVAPWRGALHQEALRTYPSGKLLAHTIGYVKRQRVDPKSLVDGQSLYGSFEGVIGLEKAYNAVLAGMPGEIELSLDVDGVVVKTDVVKLPKKGRDLVTTLDLEMATLADRVIQGAVEDPVGAFVSIDVTSGEIVGMQSWPSFDLNVFVPSISSANFRDLGEDSSAPLFGRAVSASYPPGGLFKPLTALAALKSGGDYGIHQAVSSWETSGGKYVEEELASQ